MGPRGVSALRNPSVLFVCTGNTCHSVMAEALARRRFGDRMHVASAGISPGRPEDARSAIDTLRSEFDWNTSAHIPRDVRDVEIGSFDYVVAMDKHVARKLQAVPKDKLFVWNIDDPWGDDDMEAYRRCALLIMKRLSRFPPGLASDA